MKLLNMLINKDYANLQSYCEDRVAAILAQKIDEKKQNFINSFKKNNDSDK